MQKFKLLQDWASFKLDDVVDVEDGSPAHKTLSTVQGLAVPYQGDVTLLGKAYEGPIIDEAIQAYLSGDHRDTTRKAIADMGFQSKQQAEAQDPTLGYGTVSNNPTAMFGAFLKDVFSAGTTGTAPERLNKSRDIAQAQLKAAGSIDGQNTQLDDEGGFFVPTMMANAIISSDVEVDHFRSRATTIPMTSQSVDIPILVDYDHSDSTIYNGIRAYWTGEAQTITSSKAKMGSVGLKLNKLSALAYATHEIMRWSSPSVAGWLTQSFREAVRFAELKAFFSGTGSGQPLGILNGGSVVTVAKEGSQAADTVNVTNLAKMLARLRERRPASTVWFASRSIIPQLVNASVSNMPVFQPSIRDGVGATLFGRPIVWTEYCEDLGDLNDIVLTDLSQYLIGDDSSGAELATSIHVRFTTAENAFRIIKYCDGQPLHDSVFTPYADSANTLGSTVNLAARA